jgi:hypothetical protein
MNEVRDRVDPAGIDAFTQELLARDEGKRKRPHHWVCLDATAIAICWDILLKNSTSHSCRAVKNSYLFTAPFRISIRDGKELHLKPEVADEFEQCYTKFAQDFLDCVMVMGIVPFCLVQLDNGHYVPRIPAPDTYVIQMAYATEDERRYYRVWRPKMYSINHGDSRYSGSGIK